MTPKEKAIELVDSFYQISGDSVYDGITKGMAKKCALIAVDEMILFGDRIVDTGLFGFPADISFTGFLKEVKQEIEKL